MLQSLQVACDETQYMCVWCVGCDMYHTVFQMTSHGSIYAALVWQQPVCSVPGCCPVFGKSACKLGAAGKLPPFLLFVGAFCCDSSHTIRY
jgi:hypothetical protein